MKKLARYTLGYVFDLRMEHGGQKIAPPTSVVLIRKAKPDWQRGRLNGLGGKFEPGESPAQCISREVEEESRRRGAELGTRGALDVTTGAWRHFGVLRGAEVYHHGASSNFEIHLFATFLHIEYLYQAEHNTRGAVEPLQVVDLRELMLNFDTPALPNVRWMVAMALSFQHGEAAQCFDVRELTLASLMGESEQRAAEEAESARKSEE